jgi:hypothetical protein
LELQSSNRDCSSKFHAYVLSKKQLPTISMPLVAWARDAESLEQIPSFHGVPAIREPTHSHAVGEEGPTPPSQTALCPGQPYALVTLYAVDVIRFEPTEMNGIS